MNTQVKKFGVIVGAALVGVLTFSAVSFAQTPDTPTSSTPVIERIQQGIQNGFQRGGPGGWGGQGGPGGFGEMREMRGERHAALAEALGMTIEELQTALQNGQTIEEIAAEKGVDLAAFKAEQQAARLAQAQEWLAQAVADGKLTQEQADQMLERMQNGERPDFGGRRGPGGQWGPRDGQNGFPFQRLANPNL